MLQVDNVDIYYGDFQAIRNVSFQVPERSIISIIGSNGAGKSTLLKAIAGLLKPYSGKIIFKGKDITGLMANKIVAEGISLVPEGRRIFPRMTVYENLIIGSYTPKARRKNKELLNKVFELFPVLKEKSQQIASNLSGGQQQMLAIGRALMSDPELIIFDEISLGLAPLIVKEIYQKISEINREGTTVVLVEQDVRRSLKASEFSYVMRGGEIVLTGKSSALEEEDVKVAYFGL
ncbi:ABC transporter ATP-binding protein [Moorella sulfitireducens (nom. illeg.)]|uniref:ABC transporter ATP-binding protein n=1 Tax=Neomoorella sulfitireducens TaxID=2972948 RepID=UPI0021ABD70D